MPTVGIEPTAPPPSRSAVQHTNHYTTAPFQKKNGLDAAYNYAPSTATRFFRQMLPPSLPNTAPA